MHVVGLGLGLDTSAHCPMGACCRVQSTIPEFLSSLGTVGELPAPDQEKWSLPVIPFRLCMGSRTTGVPYSINYASPGGLGDDIEVCIGARCFFNLVQELFPRQDRPHQSRT